MGPASSGMVTAGIAGEDMRSFKEMRGSEVKERGWRVGGVRATVREGERGGWDGGDRMHILLSATSKLKHGLLG